MQGAFQTIWLSLFTSPFSSPLRVLVMSFQHIVLIKSMMVQSAGSEAS